MEDHLVYAKSSKKSERDRRVAECLVLRRSAQSAVDTAKDEFDRASAVLGTSVVKSALAEAAVQVAQSKPSRWSWLLKWLRPFNRSKKVTS